MSEKNQQRWWGIRPTSPEEIFTRYEPPEGCTFVTGYNGATGTTVVVYTVPVNTVLYLTDIIIGGYSGVGAIGDVYIKTGAHALYKRFMYGGFVTGQLFNWSHNFTIAEQLPATYYIGASSGNGNLAIYVSVFGYTRPV